MKKILLFILLSSIVIANDVENLANKGYENSILKSEHNVEVKKLEFKKKNIKLGNYNGLNLLANYNTDYNSELEKIKEGDRNLELKYGNFSIYYNYDFESEEKVSAYISGSKDLNDFFYGDLKTKRKNIKLEEKMNDINISNAKKTEIISILNKLKSIYSLEKTLVLKTGFLDNIEKEYANSENKLNLGSISKIEYETVKIKKESLEIESENLKADIKTLKKNLEDLYKINAVNLLFKEEEINYEDIGKDEIEYEKLFIESLENNIKLSDKSDIPNFNLSFEKNLDKEEYVARFTVSLDLDILDDNYDSKIDRLSLETEKIKLEEKKRLNKLKIIELKEEFNILKRDLISKKSNLDLEINKEKFYKKKYDLGQIDYMEYLEHFENLEEQNLNYITAETEFKFFTIKLKYQ